MGSTGGLSSPRAHQAYPRDTRGDDFVSRCKTPLLVADDLDGNGAVDESELSRASERATPSMDQVREWELGGWKSERQLAHTRLL